MNAPYSHLSTRALLRMVTVLNSRPCDICNAVPTTACRLCGLLLCGACKLDSADHREYCKSVQDGAAGMTADTTEAIVRAAIGMYMEFRDGGYEPQEALECAVIEVLEGLSVDLDAIRAEMATQPQVSALDSADWPY